MSDKFFSVIPAKAGSWHLFKVQAQSLIVIDMTQMSQAGRKEIELIYFSNDR